MKKEPIQVDGWRRLAVLLPNWLGDAVMAEPSLTGLHQAFPDLEIIGFGRPAAVAALRGQCGMSSLHVLEDRGMLGPLRAARDIRAFDPDAILILRGSFRSALVARLAGCPVRIGTTSDGRGFLLSHSLETSPKARPRPTTALYAEIVEAMGITAPPRPPSITLQGTEADAARALLAGLERPILGVVPGGSKLPKRWPPERFAAAIQGLGGSVGSCVLLGSPEELEILREIRRRCDTDRHPPVRNLAENGLSLETLRGAVASCDVLLGNDTGPRHLAIATGTPTVALFGPTDHRWTLIPDADERFLLAEPFLDDDHIADRHPDTCRIDRIPVGDVVHAVKTTLESSVSLRS